MLTVKQFEAVNLINEVLTQQLSLIAQGRVNVAEFLLECCENKTLNAKVGASLKDLATISIDAQAFLESVTYYARNLPQLNTNIDELIKKLKDAIQVKGIAPSDKLAMHEYAFLRDLAN